MLPRLDLKKFSDLLKIRAEQYRFQASGFRKEGKI